MKIKRFHQLNELKVLDNKYRCAICGSLLYRTDAGGNNATLQCSSDAAKFWNFGRGTQEQKEAHEHFMKSLIHIPTEEWHKLEKI